MFVWLTKAMLMVHELVAWEGRIGRDSLKDVQAIKATLVPMVSGCKISVVSEVQIS